MACAAAAASPLPQVTIPRGDHYTPVDETQIPTGEVLPVKVGPGDWGSGGSWTSGSAGPPQLVLSG